MASAELDELIVADAEALRAWLSANTVTGMRPSQVNASRSPSPVLPDRVGRGRRWLRRRESLDDLLHGRSGAHGRPGVASISDIAGVRVDKFSMSTTRTAA